MDLFWFVSRKTSMRSNKAVPFFGGIWEGNGENIWNFHVFKKRGGCLRWRLYHRGPIFLFGVLFTSRNCCRHKQSLELLDFDVFADSSMPCIDRTTRDHSLFGIEL